MCGRFLTPSSPRQKSRQALSRPTVGTGENRQPWSDVPRIETEKKHLVE